VSVVVGDGGVCPGSRILAREQGVCIHEQRGELECKMIVTVERTGGGPGGGRQKMRHTTKIQRGLCSPVGKTIDRNETVAIKQAKRGRGGRRMEEVRGGWFNREGVPVRIRSRRDG